MKIGSYFLENRVVAFAVTLGLVLFGWLGYQNLPQLEFPDFTIKNAVIVTAYPGATAQEVADEVTDQIEVALQTMEQLERVESTSSDGLSVIMVQMYDYYDGDDLPQVWDELRRKVGDIQGRLPPGVYPSQVNDSFGDVYGILYGLTGEGFSDQELTDYAKELRRELLLVDGVARIDLWGIQDEVVYVEPNRTQASKLGIGFDSIIGSLQAQNQVAPAGAVPVGDARLPIRPSGAIDSVQAINDFWVRDPMTGNSVRMSEVAHVQRSTVDPESHRLLLDGKQAISIGVSMRSGYNVVELGAAVEQRLAELEKDRPIGLGLTKINDQAEDVAKSVDAFLVSFLEAVAIVVVVLLLTMGWRTGLLIGVSLIITVLGTLGIMEMAGIQLQRISLGALIIALGMLVDNSIVVAEGMQVRMQKGEPGTSAASNVVRETAWPLLGATVIAILAFAAIGLSNDATGEFLGSLYQVMLISLGLSWVVALTLTTLFCDMMLPKPKAVAQVGEEISVTTNDDGATEAASSAGPAPSGADSAPSAGSASPAAPPAAPPVDPYGGWIFEAYRRTLKIAIRFRWITVALLVVLMVASGLAFTQLKNAFFPSSERAQLVLDYRLPPGTKIDATTAQLEEIASELRNDKRVASTATFIGRGAPRFTLSFAPETTPSESFGTVIISLHSYEDAGPVGKGIEEMLHERYPQANATVSRIALGPPGAGVQVRWSGPDPEVLRQLSEETKEILRTAEGCTATRDNWKEPVDVVVPQFNETKARRVGVSRSDLAGALAMNFDGRIVGLFRDGDDLIPIKARAPLADRENGDSLDQVQVWSSSLRQNVPIHQVVDGLPVQTENGFVRKRNRRYTITTECSEKLDVLPAPIWLAVHERIEAIETPDGYKMEWGGNHENQERAQRKLGKSLPLMAALIVLTLIALFNTLRQPLIIVATVPLALIGVGFGLYVADLPFNFPALLAFLSLSGMLIKGAIVLIEQIDIEQKAGSPPAVALVHASVTRLRPVTLAAMTTVLGMIPLVTDAFFQALAVTIMSGLTFATVLTLVVVPVFYAIVYRVKV